MTTCDIYFEYHDVDKLIDFGIDMCNDEYKNDIDSFAYEEYLINVEVEWNVDTVIQTVNEQFNIIMEEEWNSYMDNITEHTNDNDMNTNNSVTIDGEYIAMCMYDGHEFEENDVS